MFTLKKIADVILPTRWANFNLLAFEGSTKSMRKRTCGNGSGLDSGKYPQPPPLVRIHSQCTTGEVFHSIRCDCYEQLHLALSLIAEQGAGVVVYDHQEGRGIGLIEKLRAYELQDQGLDTIEANLRLGHAVDLRNYALSVEVLRFLNIRSLQLMTNNPEKLQAVRSAGIEIARRVSADIPANPHSAQYLSTKRDKLGHLFNSAESFLTPLPAIARSTPFLERCDVAGGPAPPTPCILFRHRIARYDIELTIPRQLPEPLGLRYVLQGRTFQIEWNRLARGCAGSVLDLPARRYPR